MDNGYIHQFHFLIISVQNSGPIYSSVICPLVIHRVSCSTNHKLCVSVLLVDTCMCVNQHGMEEGREGKTCMTNVLSFICVGDPKCTVDVQDLYALFTKFQSQPRSVLSRFSLEIVGEEPVILCNVPTILVPLSTLTYMQGWLVGLSVHFEAVIV